ncbi:TolC family outer membrane protein [Citrobacter sp. Awk 4]|uniref:TolC family outer membrane protein n=1 Tax=Citrobacter sp. Awk 4 TaxID=2963955 RepID=UPI0023040C78|nr:TolC family outer membrane protein [Citrobacter sp. Awk 4]MDA8478313.1 TolC family outer membrane protein [Citrobacter sp. Awk 4]
MKNINERNEENIFNFFKDVFTFATFSFCLALTGNVHAALVSFDECPSDCPASANHQPKSSVLSLQDSILSAISISPEMAEIRATMNVDKAKISESKGAWLPQVFVNGASRDLVSSDNQDAESYGISVSQLLYDFGRTTNTIKQAETTAAADAFRLQASLNTIAEKVTLLYVRANRYQTLIQVAEENIASLRSVEKLATLRAGAGLSSSSDVLQAQTRAIAMQTSLEEFRYQHVLAMRQLAILTGIDAASLSTIPEAFNAPLAPFNTDDYDTLPAVKAALTDKKSAEYSVSRAKAGHMPSISLRADHSYGQNGSSAESSWDDHMTVNVSVPLYQGGIVSSQVEQAQGDVLGAQARVNQEKMDAQQRIDSFHDDWVGAIARKANGEHQLKAALKTREVYRNEYTLNARSLNDLLSVEQDVFQAEQAVTSATFDVEQAAVSYSISTNTLLKQLRIEP